MSIQRVLHLIDHESEAGEIETAHPTYFAMAGFVTNDETDHGAPEKKINDVAKFSREPANRFEQDRHRRDEDDSRRSQKKVLREKDKRLKRRFATDQEHSHRAEHEDRKSVV